MTIQDKFKDNPNGVITDEADGLFWLPKDSFGDLGKWVNWKEAKQYMMTMAHVYAGGFCDWRIPTRDEALSLYVTELENTDHEGKAIHIAPVFVRKCGHLIWTSEENEAGQALRINLRDGTEEYIDKEMREFLSVRGVRSGR